MWLFNKSKTVEDIAYKLFLKDSWMFDTSKSKTLFNLQCKYDNNYYQEKALLKIRNEKISKIKSKL